MTYWKATPQNLWIFFERTCFSMPKMRKYCQRRKENNEKRRKENDRNAGIITAGLLIVS